MSWNCWARKIGRPPRRSTIAQRFNAGSAARNAVSPEGTKETQRYSNHSAATVALFRPSRDLDMVLICNPALKRWAIVSNRKGRSHIITSSNSEATLALFEEGAQ